MPLAAIVGHRPVVALLREAVARERVPQSLLFAGQDGVGKRTVAVALAQAVNCPNRRDGDACGSCPTCSRIERGTHSDVVVLDKGGEASIKLKALRERVLDLVGYRPFEAVRRVFIIDSANDLATDGGQDALLKTLEEPPSSTVLILISARPDALLPTVQSRCRRLRFGPLAEADVARVLAERMGLPADRARARAAVSGGSVARALSAEEDGGPADRDAALALLRAAARPAVAPRLAASASLAKHGSSRRDREALDARLAALASLTRDLGAIRAGARRPLANLDLESDLHELASSFGANRLDAAFDAVVTARRALERNASPKIVADWLAVRM